MCGSSRTVEQNQHLGSFGSGPGQNLRGSVWRRISGLSHYLGEKKRPNWHGFSCTHEIFQSTSHVFLIIKLDYYSLSLVLVLFFLTVITKRAHYLKKNTQKSIQNILANFYPQKGELSKKLNPTWALDITTSKYSHGNVFSSL